MRSPTAMLRIAALLLTSAALGGGLAAGPCTVARADDGLRGARYPALSPDASRIAFSYWGDIWTAPADGSTSAIRLTDHIAFDSYPRYSPDGAWIAFNSDRGGSPGVWLMAAEGGEARELTSFSGGESLSGWTPDGRIIHSSLRGLWGSDLFVVDPEQGEALGAPMPLQLTRLDHYSASFAVMLPASAPGGGGWVYQRGGGRWWRKGYRGTSQPDLWRIYPDGHRARITDFKGMDEWPMASPDGATVYYVCDESGIDNLWSLSLVDGARRQITHYQTDGVQWPCISGDGKTIAYEWGGGLYCVSTAGGSSKNLEIHLAGEGKGNLVFRDSFSDSADESAASPNGRYIVFSHAGDLWAVKDPKAYEDGKLWKDKKKPDQDTAQAWRLTATDNARERMPVFAADNRHIAYISDAAGNYDVYVMDLDDLSVKQVTTAGHDDCTPQFDPVSSDVLFYYSGNRRLLRQDLKTGAVNTVAEGRFRGSFYHIGYSVSPDGTWVCYVNEEDDWSNELYIVDSLGREKPVDICHDQRSESGPRWSADGRRLSFTRDGSVYVIDLSPETDSYDTSLLFEADRKPKVNGESKADSEKDPDTTDADSESEDEEAKAGDSGIEKNGESANGDEKSEKSEKAEKDKKVEVKIDFRDIWLRARVVSQQRDAGSGFLANDGEWLIYEANPDGKGISVWAAKVEGGDSKKLKDGGWSGAAFSADGKRIYFRDGNALKYMKYSDGASQGIESVPAKGELWVDQRARWRQMYREGWRTLREQFYDQEMHGADWDSVYSKYLPLIERINTPEEFSLIFQELLGELNASHLGITMASSSFAGPVHSTCHLGLEFDPQHKGPGLKVVHITYRGPCDQPGVEVKPGDVLLRIEGQAVRDGEYWWPLLNDKEGKPVKLSFAGRDGGSEREHLVRPVTYGSYQNLLYREWEVANEEKVARLSDGRIGYIHIRGMSRGELEKFERELKEEVFSKDALIVDVRFNPGGFIHEQLFELLDRSPFGYAGHRDAQSVLQPAGMYNKPKALLINASSGSDAEIFPTGWRNLKLGPIIGIDTAGAVIGTTGFSLMDGSYVRLPLEGWWDLDGRNLETGGTPPDIYVDVDPDQLAQGIDAQLEKAVEVLMQQLAKPAR